MNTYQFRALKERMLAGLSRVSRPCDVDHFPMSGLRRAVNAEVVAGSLARSTRPTVFVCVVFTDRVRDELPETTAESFGGGLL